jgi:Ca-activated chloride channel family protein
MKRNLALTGLALVFVATGLADGSERPPAPVPDGWTGCGTGGLHVLVDGRPVQMDFPLKHTDVRAEVSGPVTRVEVTQTFANPYEDTIEAVYVFPLPHEAAVSDMTMRLGERVIKGVIDRRAEARRIYEEARRQGKVAALLEQERPNIFTQSVANILPGNEVEITLTYVETLDYENGTYELAFPENVVPAGGDPTLGRPAPGGPEADRINPPFLPPTVRSGHDIAITVALDSGVPFDELSSPTHAFSAARRGRSQATVTLNPLDTIPNKDFVLRWRVAGDDPETAVLASHDGRDGYLTILLHPELAPSASEITPKEMIFVLDCSGSMSGEPMAAAKGLVRHALRQMNATDTFQIIRFSSNASGLSPVPLAVTPDNVRDGIAYLETLNGSGGTMMIEGIKAALDTPRDDGRLRIVMFLTDGYIGNDEQILAAVRRRIGDARLFSFGVGSSVNRYLLDGLAEEGRGEVAYFLPGSEVKAEVAKFYDRIRSPYLTDIELVWNGVEVADVYPLRVPDLFAGRPLKIHARYADAARGDLEVRGKIAGREWHRKLDLDLPNEEAGNPALGSLWARARIGDLQREMRTGEQPALVEEITQLALRHSLVTKYTSLVAVEERIVVSDGNPRTVRVPVEMPEGVSYEGVFGELRSEEMAPMPRQAGMMLGRASAAKAATPVSRPRTDNLAALEEPLSVMPHDKKEHDRPNESPRVRVRIEAMRQVAAGDDLELEITLENTGRSAASVPRELSAKDLRLRVTDRFWIQTRFGSAPAPPSATLSAGGRKTYRVRLKAADFAFLRTPGTYHLILEGAFFAGEDSNRVTVRVS